MLKNNLCIIIIFVFFTLSCSVLDFPQEIREAKHISNFTRDGDFLYFGAGYKLFRLTPSTQAIETVFTTDRVLIEQPLIADETVYFGGRSRVDNRGNQGEYAGLFAIDLQSKKLKWKFNVDGFGSYPVIAEDKILVCSRERLYCLDRKNGKELWKLNNWLGTTGDNTTIPYFYKNSVYYKISEEYFIKSDANDGHWAEVSLDDGQRKSIIQIAENPGTYHDSSGNGIGNLTDGVIYGAIKYDKNSYPNSRFGAIDLESKKMMWEVLGSRNRSRPAVNSKYVFTDIENSIHALDQKTGKTIWSESLGEILETNIDYSQDRLKWEFEYGWSRRFIATDEIVIAQGSKGIVARNSDNGKLLWSVKNDSETGDSEPIIFNKLAVFSSVKDCSVFALDLQTGKEVFRISIPECNYFYIFDD